MNNFNYSILANNKLKDKSFLYDFRKNIVQKYLELKSYRKTAKFFGINPKTVMKWVKRYKEQGISGLKDLPRRPKRIHYKLSQEEEMEIVKMRRDTGFGARRLKYEFGLGVSAGCIYRILKKNGLIKKIRRKYQKKRDLRREKEKLKPFEVIQMDVKYLDDIPEFYKYYKLHKLPRYQVTVRDVRSGCLYYFYTYEKSVTSTIMSIKILFEHLKRYRIKVKEIIVQVDNGSEFSGIKVNHDRGFKKYVEKEHGARVRYIPPRCPNANADVEASHRLIEDEFYKREKFISRNDFMMKASTYQFYFNFFRKNSYKGYKSPVDILREYNINEDVALLSPVIVDEYFYKLRYRDFDVNCYNNILFHHVCDPPEKFIKLSQLR